MREIYASEFGVIPGREVTQEISSLLHSLRQTDGPKRVIIDSGEYHIDSVKAEERMLYITNSCADNEWDKGQTPHLSRLALAIDGAKDVEICAEGAKFVMDGQVTNLVITDSENVTIDGLTFDAVSPDMHTLKVIDKGFGYVDYELDSESKVAKKGAKLCFVGKDYCTKVNRDAAIAWHNAFIPKGEPDTIMRRRHPLSGSIGLKMIAPNVLRARYLTGKGYCVGDTFVVYMHHRRNAGIFIAKSKNVILKNITQHFNYGLCLVVQDSENLTVSGCNFVPRDCAVRPMASVADFIQICMCKGDFLVENCRFEGAGDDTLNVHGFHYRVMSKADNKVTVSYIHPQSFGFNPLHKGDEVNFVDRSTLEILGHSRIVSTRMTSTHDIELELENAEGLNVGNVIEDITMCPNLTFRHNFMTRIITRGMLITTRGKVLVEDNVFDNCTMNSILISNDAKSWYESGRVTDVTIRRNVFNRCPEYTVCVMPENGSNRNIVHSGITITDNVINSEKGGFYIKCADDVVIKNNKFTKNGYEHKFINSVIDKDIE